MRNQGITLIEMLIAAVIGVALLGLIAAGLRSGSDSLRFVQNSQLLTEDLRNAGNLVSDYLATAAFIYPPGVTLTIGAAGGFTVRNPRTNNNTWVIGQDPAIAMIRPPAPCRFREQVKVQDQPDQYEWRDVWLYAPRFVMVYPLNRGWVTRQARGAENPGPDPQNDGKWLLYIYVECLDPRNVRSLPNGLPEVIPTTLDRSRGYLLADYVQPGGFVVSYSDCLAFDEAGIATLTPCPAAPPSPLGAEHSAARVGFSLQGEIRQGGRDTRIPANPLRFEAAPRNLPKRLAEVTLH